MSDTTERSAQVNEPHEGALRHPSGWWKASDGQWYRPEQDPESTNDLTVALSIAVGAIVLGSFLPWAHSLFVSARGTDGAGNLTLLLGGIAGALIARWRLDGGVHRGLMTASVLLCASASAILLGNIVRVAHSAQPQSGLFLATAGALTATVLASVLRRSTQVPCQPA